MRWVVACALAIGCGGGSRATVSNRAAQVPPEPCTDHRYAMRAWMSFVVSADPHDDHIPDDVVESAWRSAEPSFVPCFARAARTIRVGVELEISETGVAHQIATWGSDAAVDHCVCEAVARIAFPPIHPRVFARLAVGQ